MEDLELWDEETKPYRAHLIFHKEDIQELSALFIMSLRARAGS